MELYIWVWSPRTTSGRVGTRGSVESKYVMS